MKKGLQDLQMCQLANIHLNYSQIIDQLTRSGQGAFCLSTAKVALDHKIYHVAHHYLER